MSSKKQKQKHIDQLLEITRTLRAPGGCPWDREQTHQSIRQHLIEEAYEVLEAITLKDDELLKEELGDLLFQVVFHSQMAAEAKRFTFDDVAQEISTKLIRRHPHVFGTGKLKDSEAVITQWEEIKKQEKANTRHERKSITDGVPKHFPALMRAAKIQKKVAKVGFDWDHIEDVLDKVEEEIRELRQELKRKDRRRIEEEVGDLLFSITNVARFLKLDPEESLQYATNKFVARFRKLEALAAKKKLDIHKMNLKQLDALWDEVKSSGSNRKNSR